MRQKISALLLAAVLAVGPLPALAAGQVFPAVNTYPGYADVKEGDWYYDNARLCYEIGLMTGTDRGFEPTRDLSVAECATLAARLLEGYTGRAIPANAQGAAWYQCYVDYLKQYADARTSPIYSQILWENVERAANRYEFALFMHLVIDGNESAFPAINTITAGQLPDESESFILTLYNAGILTGKDDYGTFDRSGVLTRAEAAAMVSRMARSDLRKHFTPQAQPAQQGPYDAFVNDYLEGGADAIYFVLQDRAATAGDFLAAALEAAEDLNTLCTRQGVSFAWDNTLDMGDQGQTTFISYVYARANSVALDSAGTLSQSDSQAIFDLWCAQTYKAKHILITEEGGGKDTADMLYKVLESDPSQFEPLLAIYGEDPGMASYPDGYVFGPGEMVAEFEAGTAALSPNQISQPIQSAYGYHIILRLPLTQADYETYGSGQLIFTPDFIDGINVTAAYAAWQAYNH